MPKVREICNSYSDQRVNLSDFTTLTFKSYGTTTTDRQSTPALNSTIKPSYSRVDFDMPFLKPPLKITTTQIGLVDDAYFQLQRALSTAETDGSEKPSQSTLELFKQFAWNLHNWILKSDSRGLEAHIFLQSNGGIEFGIEKYPNRGRISVFFCPKSAEPNVVASRIEDNHSLQDLFERFNCQ